MSKSVALEARLSAVGDDQTPSRERGTRHSGRFVDFLAAQTAKLQHAGAACAAEVLWPGQTRSAAQK
jgi:hypothetical protein